MGACSVSAGGTRGAHGYTHELLGPDPAGQQTVIFDPFEPPAQWTVGGQHESQLWNQQPRGGVS